LIGNGVAAGTGAARTTLALARERLWLSAIPHNINTTRIIGIAILTFFMIRHLFCERAIALTFMNTLIRELCLEKLTLVFNQAIYWSLLPKDKTMKRPCQRHELATEKFSWKFMSVKQFAIAYHC
jgi:hypothetical protein